MSKYTLGLSLLLGFLMIGGLGFFIAPVHASNVTVSGTNKRVVLSLTIVGAEYTDADNDGLADDVVAYFDITLSGTKRYTLDIYPSLELPSGTIYTYAYTINTRLEILHCVMYFYNHATETGDYIFSVDLVSFTGGPTSGTTDFIFDPPGGSGDADPCGALDIIA